MKTQTIKTPDISDAEWDVMKIVWDRGPLTSGQIVRELESERNWKPRTIKTLLTRLVRKGAVAAREDDGKFLYFAKVAREACVRRESRSFLSRVFNGDVAPALVHLLKDAKLSETEIQELKQILERGRE
jgi:BlaI family penicillinase repressor